MDQIKALLLKTGWNCDELIKNINEFKLQCNEDNTKTQNETVPTINEQREEASENSKERDSHHYISFEEVEIDHSYTCRKASNHNNREVQNEINKKDARKLNENRIRRYLQEKKRTFRRKVNYSRNFRNKYRLQRKHASTDRKMLICKYKSKEVVRNEIMHQLELLRSKRTLAISSNMKQTVISDQIFLKKRYSGDKLKENVPIGIDKMSPTGICYSTNLSNDVYSISTTLGQEINTEKHIENKEDLYSIKPTKTNDITKIKGWKNKKFTSLFKNRFPIEHLPSTVYKVNVGSTPESSSLVNPVKSDSKSAFASTNLDGFLHDSANLYISFDIPTLDSGNNESTANSKRGADPPAKSDTTVSASLIRPLKDSIDERLNIGKIDTVNLYRPRTLGQKRRIWKLKTDTKLKKRVEDVAKPRTLAEKRRMLDYDMDIKSKLQSDGSGDNSLKYSYVLHRGRRLRIPTRSESGIIAYIKSNYGKKEYIYVPKKVRQNKIKPSIFATTSVLQPQIMKYRPGPLSKKIFLQEYSKDWRTEIRQLPKVYLQVTPRLNKPIYPKIRHLLPQYEFELTEERISFALSALHTNNDHPHKSFTFSVPYANKQEYILLRRKINSEKNPLPQIEKTEDNKTVEESVETIIDKILNYVEIKNISEEVVRDDVTEKILQEEKANRNEQQNNISKKRKTKQSKTNYELKRLNVKVIEVNLEDKGENDDCKKDFCRLGCVCKSLSTTSSLVSNHCGVPDCMFECKCNYEKKSKGNLRVTLPIGTDLLSEGAVNRLEVEAKKNLAKVEKEFTQTVIQANNQTIVVGGCTNRQRRVTKLPKKYTDFIDDSDGGNDTPSVIEEVVDEAIKIDQKLRDWRPVPCSVQVTKLNLPQVVPYCMVHHLYDCYCKCRALYETNKEEFKAATADAIGDAENIYDTLFRNEWIKSGVDFDIQTGMCARTKGLPTNYYLVRNKSEKFIATRKRKLDKMYKNYVHQVIWCESGKESENVTVHVVEEPEKINTVPTVSIKINEPEKINTVPTVSRKINDKKTRRKQSLLIRRDSSPVLQSKPMDTSENAIQRRKKHRKLDSLNLHLGRNEKTVNQSSKETDENIKSQELKEKVVKFEQIFQTINTPSATNLFTPSLLIQEKLNEILGKNVGAETQFRLIPWDMLVKKYESNSLQLWHSTFFKKPRIIATDNRTIPKHFVNVRKYENVPNKHMIKADVIRWMVTRKVPGTNSKENIFVIIQLTKTHCELCGLWEKKQNNQTDKMVLISQRTGNLDRMYSIVKKIMFSKCKFSKQMLVERDDSDDSQKISSVTVYLPQIANNSKWRMIKLNSDFSVLSLHRNKYAIKYSDLQKVMKMAKETSYTIVLKTPEVETNYPHQDFGLYASPDCEDMIFIGPYFQYEDHDITTLRYANRELIRTEIFCKMKGLKPACTGTWLYQLNVTLPTVENVQTIDLTECESDSERRKLKANPNSSVTNRSNPLQAELDPNINEVEPMKTKKKSFLITSSDILNYESCAADYTAPPKFYKFQRVEVGLNNFVFDPKIYFVPNVPKMGFIVGYKVANRVIMHWPSSKYIVKFPDMGAAVTYIQRELNACFIKSQFFQINVRVVSSIENEEMDIFNPDMLNGYYIACKTGVLPLIETNKSTLKMLDITLSELEELAKLAAERKIFDKCYELARKLFMNSQIGNPDTTSEIIQMIINEIRHQETLERKLLFYQTKLCERRQALRVKCTGVIQELHPLVSNKMQKAMKKILNFNKIMMDEKPTSSSGDVICIDADSEEDATTESNKTEPPIKKTPTPPPPIPKITVKKIQDLKEPSTSTNQSAKIVSLKGFSILKNKSLVSESGVGPGSDGVRKASLPIDTVMRPPDTGNCKTFTIKRSFLNKKCSKFVIKTSNGKYMTIRAEDLKELPVKKLQPIAPNDPVISKLSMSTKRILMPNKSNGFLKVNFNDKSLFSDKVLTIESGQQPVQPSTSPSSSSSSSTNTAITTKQT